MNAVGERMRALESLQSITGSDRAVLIKIALLSGEGRCTARVRTLAEQTGLSARTVQRSLRRLESVHEAILTSARYHDDGTRGTNSIMIRWKDLFAQLFGGDGDGLSGGPRHSVRGTVTDCQGDGDRLSPPLSKGSIRPRIEQNTTPKKLVDAAAIVATWHKERFGHTEITCVGRELESAGDLLDSGYSLSACVRVMPEVARTMALEFAVAKYFTLAAETVAKTIDRKRADAARDRRNREHLEQLRNQGSRGDP